MSFATRQVKPRVVLFNVRRTKIEFSWCGYWYFGHYRQVDSSDGYHGLAQGFGIFAIRFLRRWKDWKPWAPSGVLP